MKKPEKVIDVVRRWRYKRGSVLKLFTFIRAMKKLLQISRGAILPSLAIALGLVFWTTTTAIVKAETAVIDEATLNQDTSATGGKGGSGKPDKGKPNKGGGVNKCDVCHNPHNYHTISIPCDQVDKFLSNHPGDFRGRCEATPVTNP